QVRSRRSQFLVKAPVACRALAKDKILVRRSRRSVRARLVVRQHLSRCHGVRIKSTFVKASEESKETKIPIRSRSERQRDTVRHHALVGFVYRSGCDADAVDIKSQALVGIACFITAYDMVPLVGIQLVSHRA